MSTIEPTDRLLLGELIGMGLAATGHALPCHSGIGMVRCTPKSEPGDPRTRINVNVPEAVSGHRTVLSPSDPERHFPPCLRTD